ncbi:MAG: MFS transporter [Trueperaceae bacterium]
MPIAAAFVAGALAHLTSNFVRTANAVIADDLVRDVGLHDAALGLTTSVFFLAFAAAQLPLGAALDRHGGRRVASGLLLVAVVGAAVFAAATGAFGLALGRTLMGIGTAGVLMGGLKTLSSRTAPARFSVLSGVLLAIGSSGTLIAATPLAWTADRVGWRAVFVAAAGVLALHAAMITVWAGDDRRGATDTAAGKAAAGPDLNDTGFAVVFRSATFWRLAAMATATTGTTFAYQSLWAGPYLNVGRGLSSVATGDVLFGYGVGVVAGYGLLGWIGRPLGPARTLAIGSGLFVLVQAFLATGPDPGAGLLTASFTALGFTGASSALLFTLARSAFPLAVTGRAVTAVNLFMFGGGFVLQSAMGAWLHLSGASHASLFAATAAIGAVAWSWYLPWARRERRTAGR